jgi:2-methylcitrate dehydratase PrpD
MCGHNRRMASAPDTGLHELAAWAASVHASDLPPAVLDKARACLLYGLSVGIASAGATLPRRVAEAETDEPGLGRRGARRLLDGRVAAPDSAAVANAVLLHVRIQEDAHPAGHVGVVVVPAALAMAEAADADGKSLLAAIAAGYEVALRIGRDHAADLSARGFRTTSTYGAFGAAAVAGRLLGLDASRMANALALAANAACGLREFVAAGTEEYAVQAGVAARNGLLAARLAAAGIGAAPSALDGPAGFYRAFGEPRRGYGERLAAGLGQDFELLAIAGKPYPTCQFHSGVVRGLAALREQADGRDVARIEVRMHPFEADFVGVPYTGPYHAFSQTFMSLPFCAALAWTTGDASFKGMHDFGNRDVLALVPRIVLIADPARRRYEPIVEVTLDGGATLGWEESEGREAYLLTWQRAHAMAASLLDEVGAGTATQRLVETVAGLASARSVSPVVDAAIEACGVATKSA